MTNDEIKETCRVAPTRAAVERLEFQLGLKVRDMIAIIMSYGGPRGGHPT
jgi:hypothetical protein